MSKQLVFLSLVQGAIAQRGWSRDYVQPMLKAADRIPEEMSPEQACTVFLRGVYGTPAEYAARGAGAAEPRIIEN